QQVTENGLESILDGTKERWFTPQFQKNNQQRIQEILTKFAANDVSGYCANCAAVRDADFRSQLKNIAAKTLIITGKEDLVTTVDDGNFMQNEIPNAEVKVLNAAHLSAVECAEEFADAILTF